MNAIRVTIVCPVKNEALTLARAIKSLRRQTHTDWRLLIFDNNSTDSTKKIAMHFSRGDSRIFYHHNFKSLSAATNWIKGLEFSAREYASEFTMFFGGDDWLRNDDYIESLLNQIGTCDGIIPKIIGPNGKETVRLYISKIPFLNRIFLSYSWKYVHIVYGFYKTDYIVDCFSKFQNKNPESADWGLAFLLLSGQIRQSRNSEYVKIPKKVDYSSAYYLGEDSLSPGPKLAKSIRQATQIHFEEQLRNIDYVQKSTRILILVFQIRKYLERLGSHRLTLRYKFKSIMDNIVSKD